ncbi:MAG: hypothetical protein VKL39_15890 [Leptolyngbyaceae bacterium]|nr:hypothetical protein [Leptolyngbyaceae bacterium]
MLKLNYTEFGLFMERIMGVPELLIAQRISLAMRLGRSLHVDPGRAFFLLPAKIPELTQLEIIVQQNGDRSISLLPVDHEFMEIGLSGSWIAESKEAHEGMFLATLGDSLSETQGDCLESLIYQLWRMSETYISSLAS